MILCINNNMDPFMRKYSTSAPCADETFIGRDYTFASSRAYSADICVA